MKAWIREKEVTSQSPANDPSAGGNQILSGRIKASEY